MPNKVEKGWSEVGKTLVVNTLWRCRHCNELKFVVGDLPPRNHRHKRKKRRWK